MSKELTREETAEWVGYYFGLQRALNKGPHTQIATELETEMGDVLLKMPPGTVEAWPAVCLSDETDS